MLENPLHITIELHNTPSWINLAYWFTLFQRSFECWYKTRMQALDYNTVDNRLMPATLSDSGSYTHTVAAIRLPIKTN